MAKTDAAAKSAPKDIPAGQKERKLWLDGLRILAILMVLFNHRVAYYSIETPQPVTVNYIIKILLSVSAKCGPPLFFMISGYLLLGKEESIKKIFTHRILRIVIVMIISAVYFVWRFRNMENVHIKLNWYFYAYLCFLLLLPFYRKIAMSVDAVQIRYFFILTFLAYQSSGILRMVNLPEPARSAEETICMNLFTSQWPSICWPLIFPFMGYFLGRLAEKGFSERERQIWFYVIIALSIATAVLSVFQILYAVGTQDIAYHTEEMRQYFAVAPSCFLFLLFQKISDAGLIRPGAMMQKIVPALGAATFGMFVIETQTTFSLTIYGWLEDRIACYIGYYYPSFVSVIAEFIIYGIAICLLRMIPAVRKIL